MRGSLVLLGITKITPRLLLNQVTYDLQKHISILIVDRRPIATWKTCSAWITTLCLSILLTWMTSKNAGSEVKLGLIVYRPPRNGPTLWEIGIPDRTAAEFYIPDPKPTLTNRLYNNSEKLVLWPVATHTHTYIDQSSFNLSKILLLTFQ